LVQQIAKRSPSTCSCESNFHVFPLQFSSIYTTPFCMLHAMWLPVWYTTLSFTHCYLALYRIAIRAVSLVVRTVWSVWHLLLVVAHLVQCLASLLTAIQTHSLLAGIGLLPAFLYL
jgi:hypothetical protein